MCERVMLIDDSSIDNFVNQRMIERYEFSKDVMVFTRAEKALRWLQEMDKQDPVLSQAELPGVIFLDLNMPVMNGHQFLNEFNKLSENLKSSCKVVVLSSTINPADVSLAMKNYKLFAFFSKPMMKNNLDKLNMMIQDQLVLA